MNTKEIDLELYRTTGSKVFTGRDRGESVRKLSQIDELIAQYDEIQVIVPEDIRSINPSFLEEFLNNVVVKLKSLSAFYSKVKFISKGKYDIQSDLEEAVERILREETALIH